MSDKSNTPSGWQAILDIIVTTLTFLGPGRRAGFHVDAIVAYARRPLASLTDAPPRLRRAEHQARDLIVGMSVDMFIISIGIGWGQAAAAVRRSDVMPAVKVVMQHASGLGRPTTDPAAARRAAELLLTAAQELKATADAFEQSRDAH